MQDRTHGTAETFGVASPDPWMQGYHAHGRGERHTAPCWFLPDDQKEWLTGWLDAECAAKEAGK